MLKSVKSRFNRRCVRLSDQPGVAASAVVAAVAAVAAVWQAGRRTSNISLVLSLSFASSTMANSFSLSLSDFHPPSPPVSRPLIFVEYIFFLPPLVRASSFAVFDSLPSYACLEAFHHDWCFWGVINLPSLSQRDTTVFLTGHFTEPLALR